MFLCSGRARDSNAAGCRVLDIQHFPSQSLNSQIRIRLQGSLLSVSSTLRSRRRCLQRHALPSNICALPPRRLSRSHVDASVEQVCVAIQSFFDCSDPAADSQSCRNIRANLPKVAPFFVLPCTTINLCHALWMCLTPFPQASVLCVTPSALAAAALALKLVSCKCGTEI